MSELTEADIKKLKVVELKSELTSRGLATNGNKAVLVARLIEFIEVSKSKISILSIDSRNKLAVDVDYQLPKHILSVPG